MKLSHIAATLGLALVTSLASAAVTFDPATGTGFVGKGDVQLAFGWNNSALQANAGGVSFAYKVSTDYEGVCTWTTGEGTNGQRTHNIRHTETYGLLDTLAYDLRQRNQVTGFNLNGWDANTPPVTVGTVPTVGGACPGNEGHDGKWSSVTILGTSGDAIVATHNGVSVDLPIQ